MIKVRVEVPSLGSRTGIDKYKTYEFRMTRHEYNNFIVALRTGHDIDTLLDRTALCYFGQVEEEIE